MAEPAEKTSGQLTLHKVSGFLVPSFVKQEEVDKLKDFELYQGRIDLPKACNSHTASTEGEMLAVTKNTLAVSL